MTTPWIESITPSVGPTSGGALVRLVGEAFSPRLEVRCGEAQALVVGVRQEAGLSVADVRTPEHPEGLVDMTVQNLHADGSPVTDGAVVKARAYLYQRPRLVQESTLTRLTRRLLRMLKAQLIENTTLSVSVDYDDTPDDQVRTVALATLPSLVVSGPTLKLNRFYASNAPEDLVVPGLSGPELLRRRPTFTVDLHFTLTGASERTAELLNMMAAVATFLSTNTWIELPRDPANLARGVVRWELAPDGDLRTNLRGRDDVRAFTGGLVIRGFDLDEGAPLQLGKPVVAPEVVARPVPGT